MHEKANNSLAYLCSQTLRESKAEGQLSGLAEATDCLRWEEPY